MSTVSDKNNIHKFKKKGTFQLKNKVVNIYIIRLIKSDKNKFCLDEITLFVYM